MSQKRKKDFSFLCNMWYARFPVLHSFSLLIWQMTVVFSMKFKLSSCQLCFAVAGLWQLSQLHPLFLTETLLNKTPRALEMETYFFNRFLMWTFMVHCLMPREAMSAAVFLCSQCTLMMLNADQSHQAKKSNLQSLRKCPSHLGQYSRQLYLSIFCFPLLWYWEQWSFNTLSRSQLSEHWNYSMRSSYQQTKRISLKKGAVRCSRARYVEYFFMKISGS